MLVTLKGFSGHSNIPLAEKICAPLGIPLRKARIGVFSDGEIQVEMKENVRGMDVFIVQSTCTPVNDHLMELLVMMDAMKEG